MSERGLDEAAKKVREKLQSVREEIRGIGNSMRREKGVLARMRERREERQDRRKSRRKD